MSSATYLRSAFLLATAAGFLGVSLLAHGQEPSKEELDALHGKARVCSHAGDDSCVKVCINAMKQAKSPEYQGLADECERLHAPAKINQDAAEAKRNDVTNLREGFSWMPDVEVVVSSNSMGRATRLIAEGREDWAKFCTGRGKGLTSSMQMAIRLRPGMRLRLSHIQYNSRECIVGKAEVL